MNMDTDLRLRSGEHAENAKRIEKQKKRDKAAKKNESGSKGKDTGTD